MAWLSGSACRFALALVELSVTEPRISPVGGTRIQRGENRSRAFLGRGSRGVDIHVIRPERVDQIALTADRAYGTVTALFLPLLGDGQWAMHPHPQRLCCQQGALQPGWLIGHQPHIVDDLIEPGG